MYYGQHGCFKLRTALILVLVPVFGQFVCVCVCVFAFVCLVALKKIVGLFPFCNLCKKAIYAKNYVWLRTV